MGCGADSESTCLSSLCSGEEQYSTQRLSDGGVRGGLKENEREG